MLSYQIRTNRGGKLKLAARHRFQSSAKCGRNLVLSRGGSAGAQQVHHHSRARRRTSAAASTTTTQALFSSSGSHRLLRRYEPAPVGSTHRAGAESVPPDSSRRQMRKERHRREGLFSPIPRLVRSQAPPRANGGSDSNTPAHSTHPRAPPQTHAACAPSTRHPESPHSPPHRRTRTAADAESHAARSSEPSLQARPQPPPGAHPRTRLLIRRRCPPRQTTTARTPSRTATWSS